MGRNVPWPLLLLLLLLYLVVKLDAFDAFSFREHRKLANSDGKGGENPTKDPQVPNQQNLDPNNKKEEPPPPTNNGNNNTPTQGKVIEGSNNSSSNNTSSPAPSPTPTLKDSNSPLKKDNKTASHVVTEDDGSKGSPKGGDGQKDGEGGGKNSGKNDDGKGNGKGGGNDNGNGGGNDNGEGGKDNGDRNKEQEPENHSQSTTTSETCDGNFKPCKDNGGMSGCISKLDPTYVVVLFQNEGNDTIKVKLNEFGLQDKDVQVHQSEKVNISLTTSARTQLTFNFGHEDCVLLMGTAGISNVVRLPSYDKILTPVNGAYFLILTVLVLGGTWACCQFRKKRSEEVPYQELEMAVPESAAATATNVESAEGWDQVWDDNWDEDVAVKSEGQPYTRSISAQGLTSRSSNKDGWEDNWDD